MTTYLDLLCVIASLGILTCNILLITTLNDYIRTLDDWIKEERKRK